MYKVILVDDEIWSLEGLAASFQWENHGFQVIGKYTDSLEAVCRIRKDHPDVVFTDIRMPDMTGIELMKEIRKRDDNVAFIIVSGYAEFEYAREAVRQGAYDYNLKPMDLSEADLMLIRLKGDLDKKRCERDELLLQRLLYENREEEVLGMLSACKRLQAIFLISACEEEGETVVEEWCRSVAEAQILHVALMPGRGRRLLFLDALDDSRMERFLLSLEGMILKKGYAGISSVGSYNQAAVLGKEAMLAASGEFMGKETGVTRYIQVSNPYYEAYGRKMTSLILSGQYEEACLLLDETARFVRQEELGIFYMVKLWNQIAILLHESFGGDKKVRIEFLDFFQISKKFKHLEELCQYIKIEIAEILVSQKQQVESQRSFNENFMELLAYVDGHYEEKLSLCALADQFYLNMTYCSELFKKVTGFNFSDYLTRLRMEKAAYLLGEKGISAKDAAEMTGYSDAFYFSKVFKKYYGVAPSCFRRKPEL